jgi:hypothetical protein
LAVSTGGPFRLSGLDFDGVPWGGKTSSSEVSAMQRPKRPRSARTHDWQKTQCSTLRPEKQLEEKRYQAPRVMPGLS